MVLLTLPTAPAAAGPLGIAIDLPLDLATLVVLLLAVGFPLLLWWGNRPSVIRRYSREEPGRPDRADPPTLDDESPSESGTVAAAAGEPVRGRRNQP